MSIDARMRRTLHDRFEQLLGRDAAEALMEHLAPDRGDLARTADIAELRAELHHEMALLSERFRADLHKEVGVALAHQTQVFAIQARTMVLAVVGAVVANGGLAFAAARLGG